MNKRESLPTPLLFFLSMAALFLLYLTRDTVHWRDSAEFILAATYLDITHPPGFSTYGSLANLFTFIPLGPLTWRVHLFGVALTIILLVLSYKIFESLTKEVKLSSTARSALFILTSLPLLFSPAIVRQATTAEAYQLNAVFILAILLCGIRYFQNSDVRYIYSAGFLGGVSLGNHASILLFLLPAYLLILPRLKIKQALWAAGFTIFGLCILSYLPLRSLRQPPLNTGSPQTTERFFSLISDERDRALRPETVTTIGQIQSTDLITQLEISRKDGIKILSETGWFIAPLAVVGLAIVFFSLSWKIALLSFVCLGSVLFFFRGWQPDPFVPVFFILSSLCAVTLATLCKNSSSLMKMVIALCLLLMTGITASQQLPELKATSTHHLPHTTVAALLAPLPYHSVFITESSWYLSQHLQQVEGVRTDIITSYLPQFLFPRYFSPVKQQIGITPFSSKAVKPELSTTPDLAQLGNYLGKSSQEISVFLEPSIATTAMLANAGNLQATGLLRIGPPSTNSEFPQEVVHFGKQLQKLPQSFLRKDAVNYLETRMLPIADLLLLQSQNSFYSVRGIREACGHPRENLCSYASHAKLVEHALHSNNIKQAEFYYNELVESRGEKAILGPLKKRIKKEVSS